MKEKQRLLKEKKLKQKFHKMEEFKKEKQQKILKTVKMLKKNEEEKFSQVKAKQEEIKEKNKKSMSNTELATPYGFSTTRPETAINLSKMKGELAQSEALRKIEERKQKIEAKKAAFEAWQKIKEQADEKIRTERAEIARLAKLKRKLNNDRKNRKENYQKQLIDQKINAVEKKNKLLKDHQSAVLAERFYTKISREMKTFYLGEALTDMSVHKTWSLKKLDNIMATFKPKISGGPGKNKTAIMQSINRTLGTPYKTISKKADLSDADDEELLDSFDGTQSQD